MKLDALFVIVGIALYTIPALYMRGHPVGAVPAVLGVFTFVIGLGNLIKPFTEWLFKDKK